MQKEKGVIIEEINMYEDLPNRHVQDLMMKLLYGDQPAGWNIAGEKKNILNMKRDDFVDYKKQHYLPEATVLVVAGAVTEKQVMSEVNKIFGVVARGKKIGKSKVKEKQNRPEVLVSFKKTDQTHFVLGIRSMDLFNKKNAVISVLGGVLGGGMSSRLFQKLREEMGVGYYVRAYNDAYTDHGFFQISAGVDNKRIEEVIKAVLEECNKLKKEKVSKEELEKVKECLIGNMKLTLESSDDIANFYGGQELLKHELKNAEDKAKEVRKVTAKQIQDLAKDIFKNEKLNLALIGPFKDKAKFLKILKF
jgi:predicted Zn-dependent peptidase